MAYDGSLPRPIPRIDDFVSAAAEVAGVEKTTLTSACRQQFISLPRQVAMYLARMQTQKSLAQVGLRFGRDHTTVLYAIEKIRPLMRTDANCLELVLSINDLALNHAEQRLQTMFQPKERATEAAQKPQLTTEEVTL